MRFLFVKVEECDLEQYKKDMQEAFQKGFEEDFGKTDESILPEEDIKALICEDYEKLNNLKKL